VAEKQKAQNSGQDAPDARLLAAALFAMSGEVAPVDFARFGKCVGEIIARSSSSASGSRRSRYSES
jgi:hypothetical protein